MSENGNKTELKSIEITLDARNNHVNFKCEPMPIALIQMIVAEVNRKLELTCPRYVDFMGLDGIKPDEPISLGIQFDEKSKVIGYLQNNVPVWLAQMMCDEVLRIVQEQRGIANMQAIQKQLAENQRINELVTRGRVNLT